MAPPYRSFCLSSPLVDGRLVVVQSMVKSGVCRALGLPQFFCRFQGYFNPFFICIYTRYVIFLGLVVLRQFLREYGWEKKHELSRRILSAELWLIRCNQLKPNAPSDGTQHNTQLSKAIFSLASGENKKHVCIHSSSGRGALVKAFRRYFLRLVPQNMFESDICYLLVIGRTVRVIQQVLDRAKQEHRPEGIWFRKPVVQKTKMTKHCFWQHATNSPVPTVRSSLISNFSSGSEILARETPLCLFGLTLSFCIIFRCAKSHARSAVQVTHLLT